MSTASRTPGPERWSVTSEADLETVALGRAVGESLSSGDVVLLTGELGAGKTRFVQGIAEGIGSARYARSPTFVLVSRHVGRLTLHHCDLYRIGGRAEVDDLGLAELVDAGDTLAVEWAERARDSFPADALEVAITVGDDTHRSLEFAAAGPRGRRLLAAARARVEAPAAASTR